MLRVFFMHVQNRTLLWCWIPLLCRMSMLKAIRKINRSKKCETKLKFCRGKSVHIFLQSYRNWAKISLTMGGWEIPFAEQQLINQLLCVWNEEAQKSICTSPRILAITFYSGVGLMWFLRHWKEGLKIYNFVFNRNYVIRNISMSKLSLKSAETVGSASRAVISLLEVVEYLELRWVSLSKKRAWRLSCINIVKLLIHTLMHYLRRVECLHMGQWRPHWLEEIWWP